MISVCVPAYLAEAYIGATIESVLAQTYPHWELLILDNASPDRTGEIARSYDDPRIVVHANAETLELADNWNKVASLSTAPYLKILCADDVLHPDCLAEQIKILEQDRDVALVASRRDFVDAAGEVVLRNRGLAGLTGHRQPEDVVEQVVRSGINPIGWPSVMLFRRRDFVDVGAFDGTWLYPMDLELSLRLLQRGSFVGMEQSLASFRISPTSASSTLKHQGAQHRSMLRHVAANSRWSIGRYALGRGLALSHLESIKKRLLFAAVNSDRRAFRQLPSMFLSRRATKSATPVSLGSPIAHLPSAVARPEPEIAVEPGSRSSG